MHFLGLIGMPRRIYTYAPDLGWNFWNLVSTIGAFVIALSFLVFIVNVVKTSRSGAVARAGSVGRRARSSGRIPSPPPVYNFAAVPTVHAATTSGSPSTATAADRGSADLRALVTPIGPIHMPAPSYWPLLTAPRDDRPGRGPAAPPGRRVSGAS